LKGVSSNYVKVLLQGNDVLRNRLIPCRIREVVNHHAVLGEAVL
jgi:hypothetical protein